MYGTLKRGGRWHHLVKGFKSVELATTHGRLYSLPEGYSALLDTADGVVHGEVFYFDALDALLPTIDALEEYDPSGADRSLFMRVEREVVLESGARARAYVYVKPAAQESALIERGAVRVTDGRWIG